MNYSILFRNFRNIRNVGLNYCTNTKNKYTPIYKFPYITTLALINRLKYYQTIITATAVPTTFILGVFNVLPPEIFLTTFGIGISGTASLYFLGLIPQKFIGFIYIKDDEKTVKLSYIDFWGRRKDTEVNISDLVPLSDLPAVPSDPLYLTMRRFSSQEKYKINLKYGIILDKTLFNKVLYYK